MGAVKWCKDPKVEHHLRLLGIKFETGNVPIPEIDRELSMSHQTRFGKKINEDWILEYAEGMKPSSGEPGSPFPMPILNKLKKGYFIWSGNHRVGAAELAGEESVDAYIVQVSDQRLCDILPRVVNSWEGRRPARDELLMHANYLVEEHSMPVADAARLLSLKPEWVMNSVRSGQVARRIQDAGADPTGFTKTLLIRMSPISDNPNVLRAVSHLLKKEKVSGREAEQIVDDVKRENTELQKLAVLGSWEKAIHTRKNPVKAVKVPHRQPVRQRLIRTLTALAKAVHDLDTPAKAQLIDTSDMKIVREQWAVCQRQMSKILSGVEAQNGQL